MLININLEEVKKLKRYHTNNLNTNGKLYTDDKYIYKVIKDFPLELEEVINDLSDNNLDFIVKPVHIIKDKDKKVGYSTLDTNEKTLFNYRRRPLELKKKDLVKAFDLVDKLAKKNLSYYDFHPGNVLVDRDFKNMKICDLDCLRYRYKDDSIKRHYLRGFGLLLSYYYNVTEEEAQIAVFNGNNRLDEDNIFRDSIKYIGTDEIKQKVKRFEKMDTNYFRHYRHEVTEVMNDRIQAGYYKGL